MLRIIKKTFALSLLALSVNAQATSLHPDTFFVTPAINDVSIVVGGLCSPNAEMCPAVEPWVEISFTHTSCSGSMPFEIRKSELENGITGIKLGFSQPPIDCAGPAFPRKYNLQLEGNFANQVYRILNPLSFQPRI